MIITLHPTHPEKRKIKTIIDELRQGAVMIYPTDSVYAFGCDIESKSAVEKILKLKNLNPTKARLSIMCKDMKQTSEYASQLSHEVFRLIKNNTPGAFTFILNSTNKIPKLFKNKKRTIGIRIPDTKIVQELIEELGRPLVTTSLKVDDEVLEYLTDPEDIHNVYEHLVNFIVDGGIGSSVPTTIVDCISRPIEVIRQGNAELE